MEKDVSKLNISKLLKLLEILQEIQNLNETNEEVIIINENSTEKARSNLPIGSSTTYFDTNAIDVDNAHRSEINSVSNNFSHSFRSSRYIMSNLSMFTDLSRCQYEAYQISKRTVRRSSAQTNLKQNSYSYISLISTAEEHFSERLTNTGIECPSTCSSFVPKSNSSKASLTSLDHRKNSYRLSKRKRSIVLQSLMSLTHSNVETSGVRFDVECSSTPKKKTPRSSTPKFLRRSNMLIAPENTQYSLCSSSSLSQSNDLFFPTFFSNFVNLINA